MDNIPTPKTLEKKEYTLFPLGFQKKIILQKNMNENIFELFNNNILELNKNNEYKILFSKYSNRYNIKFRIVIDGCIFKKYKYYIKDNKYIFILKPNKIKIFDENSIIEIIIYILDNVNYFYERYSQIIKII
jgi:hypothetical protein